MPEPTVCCILLTKDRPQMAKRAVQCFRAQTYSNKRLVIFDGSNSPLYLTSQASSLEIELNMNYIRHDIKGTIGQLRNEANAICRADTLAHWDDDDLSHPNRIAEQVALLEASGADVVGYRECLFWLTVPQSVKERYAEALKMHPPDPSVPIPPHLKLREDEAWLYSNPDPRYCIGSSLMYRREAWERRPFDENLSPTGRGEDHEFWRGLKSVGETSLVVTDHGNDREPRMICSIHAGNAKHYPIETLENSPSWKRVPSWDDQCRKAMAL